jgi:hypothetical protein
VSSASVSSVLTSKRARRLSLSPNHQRGRNESAIAYCGLYVSSAERRRVLDRLRRLFVLRGLDRSVRCGLVELEGRVRRLDGGILSVGVRCRRGDEDADREK